MSEFLFNVISKSGKVVKDGSDLTADDAKSRAMQFGKDNGYQPVVAIANFAEATEDAPAKTTEPATIAVATQLYTVPMARYIWTHQRAIRDANSKDKDGIEWQARFHWSALLMKALKGIALTGDQPAWLESTEKEVIRAVASCKRHNISYLRLDPDDPKFSFGN